METPPPLPSTSEYLASRLVGVCLKLLVALLESGRGLEEDRLKEDRSALHEVYARLKIWAADYDIEGDLLDRVLEFSEYLKEPTISFLIDLAEGLLAYESGVGFLGDSADELGSVRLLLQSAGREPLGDEDREYEEGTDDDKSESESRSSDNDGSESESRSSECSAIHDIQDAVDSLYNLSPALDFFLETFSPPDTVETVGLERMIRHMFPLAEPYLLERLSIRIAESREKLVQPASFQDEVRAGTTGPLPKNPVQRSKFVDSGVGSSVPTMARPLKSENPMPLPSVVGLRRLTVPRGVMDRWETQSTVSSQRAEITDRLPPMPEGALDGPFICKLCSRQRNRLFTRTAWRIHVFEDIQPYICINKDCSSANTPYESIHLCTRHHQSSHPKECHAACPLCGHRFESDRTEIKRYEHIFKHMERIGLFSLPPHLRDTGDEGCSLSSASNARSDASATGVTPPEETKSPEFLRWDQLKEQQVERYDARKIKEWADDETELTDENVDDVPEVEPSDEDRPLSSPAISTPADTATEGTGAEEKNSDDSLRAAQRNEATMEGNNELYLGMDTSEGTDNQRNYQDPTHAELRGGVFLGTFVSGGPKKTTEILQWMSTVPYKNHHKSISDDRLAGTGEWILKKERYCTWRASTDSKLLLLRGIPGVGKTYIASQVIDQFLSYPTAESKLAYFYCNRSEESRRDPESILRALIQQLAQTPSKDELLTPVFDIYKEREEKGQLSSRLTLKECQDLLIQLTAVYPQTTICIDALDEVDHKLRLGLLRALKHVVERSVTLVKIFATTRMDTDILMQFEMFPRIELESDDNVDDINRFVAEKVQDVIDDGRLLYGVVPIELQDEICQVLCERSKGMFQLAALQVTLLCDMVFADDVRDSLTVLPETLTDAYGEIYNRILNQKGRAPRLALNAFRWVQCSYEPLQSETLLDAVMVEVDGSGKFSHQLTALRATDLLKVCQNLLILDERQNVFRFAHHSVEEYLETQLPRVDSHTEIAKICLSLVCSSRSWSDYDITVSTREGCYYDRHLLLYSSVFWPWHFNRCKDGAQILTALWEAFVSEGTFQQWIDYHHQCVQTGGSKDTFWLRAKALQQEERDPLSTVCVFGLARKLTSISNSQHRWTARLKPKSPTTPTSHTAQRGRINRFLLCASTFGDLDIARHLLDAGADVSVANGDGWTPLHIAALNGYETLAKLLVDQGADVSAANGDGWTPLHIAALNGDETLAKLLVDQGADVSAAHSDGLTAQQVAALNGHEALARLLVDRGTDVLAARGDGYHHHHHSQLRTDDRARTMAYNSCSSRTIAVSSIAVQINTDLDRQMTDFHNHSKECRPCRNPVLAYEENRDLCRIGRSLCVAITKLLYKRAEHVGDFTVEFKPGWEAVDGLIRIIVHYNQGYFSNEIVDIKKRHTTASQVPAIEGPPHGTQWEEDIRRREQARLRNSSSPRSNNSFNQYVDSHVHVREFTNP